MTITQTVDIPADRRVRFDFEVPLEIPEGRVQFELRVVPFEEKEENTVKAAPGSGRKTLGITMKELDELLKNAHTPHSDALLGILKTDMTLDEIRMARLAKHL